MWSLAVTVLLVSIAEVCVAKPQNVQIEKQTLIKMPAEETKNDALLQHLPITLNDKDPEKKTREILDKIGAVNANLINKKDQDSIVSVNTNQRKDQSKILRNENFEFEGGYNEVDMSKDQIPDGHTIKRKVIQKVTYFVPEPIQDPSLNLPPFQQFPVNENIQDDSITTVSADEFQNQNQIFNQIQPNYQDITGLNYHGHSPQFFNPNMQIRRTYPTFYKQIYPNYFKNFPWINENSMLRTIANWFPVIIRNPLMTGVTSFVEYGPAADVCIRDTNHVGIRPKSIYQNGRFRKTGGYRRGKTLHTNEKLTSDIAEPIANENSSKTTSPAKNLFGFNPNINSNPTASFNKLDTIKNVTNEDKTKVLNLFKPEESEKISALLRRPNTPDAVSNPGFYIRKLRVRKGGVAIAGPGGVATAGGGGTAIVGPDGVVYTKPNGVAIAGPGTKIVAIPEDTDLNKLVLKLSKHHTRDPYYDDDDRELKGEYVAKYEGSKIKSLFLPEGAKIVATGPTIYHGPSNVT